MTAMEHVQTRDKPANPCQTIRHRMSLKPSITMNHRLDHIREKELISNNMLTEQSNWRLRNNSSCTALETRQHIERRKKKRKKRDIWCYNKA
ncbi:hypothetical protein VN97_g9027 [Penicillium thymicola]|uniref:Uncharacterized protein n=1 Tax=Penicillium thymicola TaxID=293382 RepID=A0AAI9X592_PENTH|nr:hypothetical protein VN97_g9027 [Penicillium thymicola]